jgi:hypothetical protein
MYKVVLLPAGCGQSALDVSRIESTSNQMAASGYELAHIYQSTTAGCLGANKSAAVLVFKVKERGGG